MAENNAAARPGEGADGRKNTSGQTQGEDTTPPLLRYSRGRHKRDNCPSQREVPDFDTFEELLLEDRAEAKGKAYICAPMKVGLNNQPEKYVGEKTWRAKHLCQSRRWLPFDLDGCPGEEALASVLAWFGDHRGLAYTTASHTPEAPRARVILSADREVSPEEGLVVGRVIARQVSEALGKVGEALSWDASVYGGWQPVYVPMVESDTWSFSGEPVEVDAVLAEAREEEINPLHQWRERAAAAGGTASRTPTKDGIIGEFNRRTRLTDILARNGYTDCGGDRWIHPKSESGEPGLKVYPGGELCYSFNDTDPLAAVGDDGEKHAHDCFSVFRILEHGGDRTAAVQAAGDAMSKEDAAKAFEPVEGGDAEAAASPWSEVKTPEGYCLLKRGVFQQGEESDSGTRLTTCAIWVSGLARDHGGTGWGCLVEWLDRDGKHHSAAFPAGRFHETGTTLASDLANAGAGIVPNMGRKLLTYLGSFEPAARFRSTPQLGWVDTPDGRLAYVLPGEVIERQEDGGTRERVVFQPERFAPTTETMHPAGALEGWQREVAALAVGNPVLVYALARAFAPPLFKLACVEGGGEHWFGKSTGGKTTMAQVSASVWGCGADPAEAPAAAFVRKWNATKNATEGLAAAHNDGLLILDEISEADARDFGKAVYMLAGGVGKARMADTANLRASRTWQVFLLSTGEISSRALLEADGRTAKAGQLVRLVDIPAEGADGGIFHDCHGMAPAAFADRLKRGCAGHFGTAGPAYIRGLIVAGDPDTLRHELRDKVDEATMTLTPPGAPPEVRRTIRRFALVDVAGTLACGMGILPFTAEDIRAAVELVRNRWLAERGMADDIDRAVEQVRAFILRHEARFRDTTRDADAPPVRDLVGYRDRLSDRFLFTPSGFREACDGFDPKAVARELARREWLHRDQSDRHTSKATIRGVGRVSVYAVNAAILEADARGVSPGHRDSTGTGENPYFSTGCPAVPCVPVKNEDLI